MASTPGKTHLGTIEQLEDLEVNWYFYKNAGGSNATRLNTVSRLSH